VKVLWIAEKSAVERSVTCMLRMVVEVLWMAKKLMVERSATFMLRMKAVEVEEAGGEKRDLNG
jgi:hypothetical protein